MKISSINQSFQGRRNNLDAFIAADDDTIRQIAYIKTAAKIDPEKDRKITNALFYSAPLAAGLGVALLSEGKNTKIFSKEVSGLAARAARGLKVTALWTAALGALDLLGYGKKKLAQNSPEVRSFDNNHPILSMGAMLAAGIGVISLVNKGAFKLAEKEAPKFLQNGTARVARFINKNAFIQNMKTGALKLADKTPSALKDIGATVLGWAPTMLLFGGLFHSIASSSRENREFNQNYSDLKEKQYRLSQARVRELSMENDFLKTNPVNKEDFELLKNPTAGIV